MDSHLSNQVLDCMQITHPTKCNIEDFSKQGLGPSGNNLSVITQNIACIYSNLDDLLVTLSVLDFDVDVIILTECRLDPNKQIPFLDNYTSYQTIKLLNQNDGVVAYIRNNHRAIVTELNLSDATGLQVDIDNYIFLGIYRSPSILNADNFTCSLDLYLATISSYKNVTII